MRYAGANESVSDEGRRILLLQWFTGTFFSIKNRLSLTVASVFRHLLSRVAWRRVTSVCRRQKSAFSVCGSHGICSFTGPFARTEGISRADAAALAQ